MEQVGGLSPLSHTRQLTPQNGGWNIKFGKSFGAVLQKVVQWDRSFQVGSGWESPMLVPRVTLDSLCGHGEKRKTGCFANIHLRRVFGFPLRGRGWGKFVPLENKTTSSKP